MPTVQEIWNALNDPSFQQMLRGMPQGLMGQPSASSNVSGMPGPESANPPPPLFNNPQLTNLFANPELFNTIAQQLLNNPAIMNM
jgi:hypothetical protein